MKYEFRSRFAETIKDMLEHRTTMGHSVTAYRNHLSNFDRFCLNHFPNESVLTKEIAFAWCNDAKGNGGYNRASIIRGFAKYVLLVSGAAYVMPVSFFPKQKAKPPFIMNDVELRKFFEATDCYPSNSNNRLLEFTVPVVFRLQFACGLRPQEVRRLRHVDFNLTDNTIYISAGKHNKDRRLPVNAELMGLCMRYDRIAEAVIPRRVHFFQSPTGAAYSKDWLEDVFDKCWKMSGNDSSRGSCTPYMLRHNYATHTLMQWVEEGRDLDAMIPYLSAYMGHEKFSSTYYYIHLLPDRLACMDFTRSDGVIPEVKDYEEIQ